MKKPPIDLAIDAVGSLAELARRLDVDEQVIVNWRKRGIPPRKVLPVEAATADPYPNGKPKVTRHQLDEELYPKERAA